MTDPSSQHLSQWDEYYLRILDLIDKHGWMVQGVYPREEDSDQRSFLYTVGLTTHANCEALIAGFPPSWGTHFLNNFGRAVRDGEIVPMEGLMVDLGADVPFQLRRMNDEHEINMARSLYEDDFEAWQLVACDVHGVYPGELAEMQNVPGSNCTLPLL